MPFVSEAQRKMMWAALTNKKLRDRLGMTIQQIKKMLEHDKGGPLPKKARLKK